MTASDPSLRHLKNDKCDAQKTHHIIILSFIIILRIKTRDGHVIQDIYVLQLLNINYNNLRVMLS